MTILFELYSKQKGGPVSGAKTLVTQVPTFVSSARPVNHPSRTNITRQHSLCPNAALYDALSLSNAKKARSTRYTYISKYVAYNFNLHSPNNDNKNSHQHVTILFPYHQETL